ncbi:hypothetical protein LQF12_02330 [Ruania suaedae]|uniref:hypothetical protein n=1 Tax=Ruania suaedae TaxID=2897774 RepID=UPI001E31D345|nr:hypothetical protein [Ruania suaedae]UFU03470.1 hypothetical protein LQF12_02330 [Ruania suaedae]
MDRLAYRIKELADVTPYSPDTIRRAIHATGADPDLFPPPLEAERDTKGYIILRAAAEQWLQDIVTQAQRRSA